MKPWKPTRAECEAARDKPLPDLLRPGLKLVFVGINPGLYSAAIGHNFGRPGNRFWPTLHAAGFTPRLLTPFEEDELLDLGYGITNLVQRATATADQLSADELREGAKTLAGKLARNRPRAVAFLGVTAYAAALGIKKVKVGPQEMSFAGIPTWVLPNPSGLNAHYQLPRLVELFGRLRDVTSPDAASAARRPDVRECDRNRGPRRAR